MGPPGGSTAAAREREFVRLRSLAAAAEAWAHWRRGGSEGQSREEADLLAALDGLEADDLTGRTILVLCSSCRRTRDGDEWLGLEEFLSAEAGIDFTHGLCPECKDRLYPDHTG